ncbi:MAG: hypothetical protein HY435_03290 [Candidatus Liptonbacteria bacterium]|nr:hypothetical protein [Candidatus Liptonbacteria bacterium]
MAWAQIGFSTFHGTIMDGPGSILKDVKVAGGGSFPLVAREGFNLAGFLTR